MSFKIGGKVTVSLPNSLFNRTVKSIIRGFLFDSVKVQTIKTDKQEIIVGQGERIAFDGQGVILVTEKGMFIGGKTDKILLVGLITALSEAKPECLKKSKVNITIDQFVKNLNPPVERRMIHVCIFPKVPFSSITKLIKLSGALGFTHVIIEFWGTYKFRALKELGWKGSLSRRKINLMLNLIRDLNMTPIPMFNHFGHASSSRMCNGKHVVLDQNLRLSPLFSKDGWRFDFEKQEVKELLSKIRCELIELFGCPEYFHIGFDESFSYPDDEQSVIKLCDFIKEISEELLRQKVTPMLWGDLYLHESSLGIDKDGGYEGNCPSEKTAKIMLEKFPKGAIICDWQYFVKQPPFKSSEYFVSNNILTAVCPWLDQTGVRSAVETLKQLNTYAYIQTTWNRVFSLGSLIGIFESYYQMFEVDKRAGKIGSYLNDATMLRKICPPKGKYERAGWVIKDVENVFPK